MENTNIKFFTCLGLNFSNLGIAKRLIYQQETPRDAATEDSRGVRRIAGLNEESDAGLIGSGRSILDRAEHANEDRETTARREFVTKVHDFAIKFADKNGDSELKLAVNTWLEQIEKDGSLRSDIKLFSAIGSLKDNSELWTALVGDKKIRKQAQTFGIHLED